MNYITHEMHKYSLPCDPTLDTLSDYKVIAGVEAEKPSIENRILEKNSISEGSVEVTYRDVVFPVYCKFWPICRNFITQAELSAQGEQKQCLLKCN